MEIYMAEKAGFCFGVKRAIKMALEGAEKYGEVCSLGPLIHNPQEVSRLAQNGVIWSDRMEDIRCKTVIIRSHGVPPATLNQLKVMGYATIDATCPFVKRAQNIARELQESGCQVVIVGDKDHPEVKGILGHLREDAVVISTPEEARTIALGERVGILAQTTQILADFLRIVDEVKARVPELFVHNTICNATIDRQREAACLAKKVDIMLVIGGKNSANTKKLAIIAKEKGAPTFIVENAKDIHTIEMSGDIKVGITAGASTPDWIIEEVMEKMKDFNEQEEKNLTEADCENCQEKTAETEMEAAPEESAAETSKETAEISQKAEQESVAEVEEQLTLPVTEEEPEENMADSYAAFDRDFKDIRRGQRVRGTVIKVSDSDLMVDIGGKSEGVIPRNELTPTEAENIMVNFKVGDEFDVIVLRRENEDGHPVLSKKRVDVDVAWEKLAKAMEEGEILSGRVIDIVKGGLLVDVGLKGFVPASLVEMGFARDLKGYKDQEIQFKVLECDKSHNKLILSRKAFLEEDKARKFEAAWDKIAEGQVLRGAVQRITNFGAFIDLDGVDGLLHVSQMAWYRVNHPSEILHIGEEIDVYVLTVDRENEKISLSLKQLTPNPWTMVPENYAVGSLHEAKVVRTASFGAFVQLEPGVEGLVHISQLSHSRVGKTEDAVSPGEIVNVKVLSFDLENKKISLSMKEAMDPPESSDFSQSTLKEEEPMDMVMSQPDDAPVTIGDMMAEQGERINAEDADQD